MAVTKFDGVIEAVRYKNGHIVLVRAYERRGATFSDHVLLNRKDLVERLNKGKKFMTGQRKEFLASTFELGKAVQTVKHAEHDVITTRAEAAHDELEGVPIF